MRTSVLTLGFRPLANLVQLPDLLDDLIVDKHDILAADILCAVAFQQQEVVSNANQVIEDRPLAFILRHRYGWCLHLDWLVMLFVLRELRSGLLGTRLLDWLDLNQQDSFPG